MRVVSRRLLYAAAGTCAATATAYFVLFRLGVHAPAPAKLSAPIRSVEIDVNGRTRRFVYFAPNRLAPKAPLLLVLHGGSGSPEQIRTYTGFEFDELAESNGFVVAYPEGVGGNWNACQRGRKTAATLQKVDDVGFALEIIAWFGSHFGIDRSKVFAAGFSNGGHMCFRLALEAPQAIAGFAAISANAPTQADSKCKQARGPSSMLLINGTDDPINPYDGGELSPYGLWSLGQVRSTLDTAASFVPHNVRRRETTTRYPDADGDPTTWAEKRTWVTALGSDVAIITLHGGGHTIPQRRFAFPRVFGRTSREIDAPIEIWQRFLQVGH